MVIILTDNGADEERFFGEKWQEKIKQLPRDMVIEQLRANSIENRQLKAALRRIIKTIQANPSLQLGPDSLLIDALI